MLKEGIIKPSTSPWASPIVIVPRGSKRRFCIDFREINKITRKDAYPIPLMSTILDRLRGAKVISTIDLRQAYHQIPLSKRSRELTAFAVPGRGLFEYTSMPFGLCNAPATFQRFIDALFGPEFDGVVFKYLDDLIIVTADWTSHKYWLRKVLRKLRNANLTINRDKSYFARSEVKYLGFLLDNDGLKIDPEKVAPLVQMEAPKNVRQVRTLLGIASWYRRYLPDLASKLEPIHRLLRKNTVFNWGSEQQTVFEQLKIALTTAPVLICPNFELPFQLRCHASAVGLGAVLSQVSGTQEKVVAYASRTLNDPEKRYAQSEKECLAAVWSILKFRPYLEGTKFTLFSDAPGIRLLKRGQLIAGRIANWALEVQSYEFEVENEKGRAGYTSGALARSNETEETQAEVIAAFAADAVETHDWYSRRKQAILDHPDRHPDWKLEQGQLYFYRPYGWGNEVLEDREVWKFVVTPSKKADIFRRFHDEPQAGHPGLKKTLHNLARWCYWPGMYRDVKNYVKNCEICQRTKVLQQSPAGVMRDRGIYEPWAVVAADIMGPFPRSKNGNQYLLVFQDLFTRWCEIEALRKATGKKIAEVFEKRVVNRWGAPRVLFSDNGTEFVNKSVRDFVEGRDIMTLTTPPYTPRCNPVERANRVLKAMLVSYVGQDHRDWDTYVSEFQFAVNSSYHSSLQASPALLNLGREIYPIRRDREPTHLNNTQNLPDHLEGWKTRLPRLAEFQRLVSLNIGDAKEKQAHYYNLRRRAVEFEPGQIVLARAHVLSSAAKNYAAKLVMPFDGPHEILRKIGHNMYAIKNPASGKISRVSVTDLKPFCSEEP